MGLRFRKSFKIAPGVRVNVSKKSVGMSVGGKLGGVSVNSKTGTTARVSAPGTGVSYSTKVGEKTKKTNAVKKSSSDFPESNKKIRKRSKYYVALRWWYILIELFFLFGGITSIQDKDPFGIKLGFIVFGVLFAFTALSIWKKYIRPKRKECNDANVEDISSKTEIPDRIIEQPVKRIYGYKPDAPAFISSTGKIHSIANGACGTDLSKCAKMTMEEAVAAGYTPCRKCFPQYSGE